MSSTIHSLKCANPISCHVLPCYMDDTVGSNFPIQLIHLESKVLYDLPQAAENLLLQKKPYCSLGIHTHHGYR